MSDNPRLMGAQGYRHAVALLTLLTDGVQPLLVLLDLPGDRRVLRDAGHWGANHEGQGGRQDPPTHHSLGR